MAPPLTYGGPLDKCMKITPTGFEGLLIIEPDVFDDSRGYFFETYNRRVFAENGIQTRFVQDNQSCSKKNVIRGLHFQKPPFAQTKLVRVITGVIQDVVVDLRKKLPTYGTYFSIELSAENKKQLLIPKGFAHGFLALTGDVEVFYKCDEHHNKESENGIVFNDPRTGIKWKVADKDVVVSEKDRLLPVMMDSPF
jgi:dTDP-4-dehydrorhamnose 3,5-epimerase